MIQPVSLRCRHPDKERISIAATTMTPTYDITKQALHSARARRRPAQGLFSKTALPIEKRTSGDNAVPTPDGALAAVVVLGLPRDLCGAAELGASSAIMQAAPVQGGSCGQEFEGRCAYQQSQTIGPVRRVVVHVCMANARGP